MMTIRLRRQRCALSFFLKTFWRIQCSGDNIQKRGLQMTQGKGPIINIIIYLRRTHHSTKNESAAKCLHCVLYIVWLYFAQQISFRLSEMKLIAKFWSNTNGFKCIMNSIRHAANRLNDQKEDEKSGKQLNIEYWWYTYEMQWKRIQCSIRLLCCVAHFPSISHNRYTIYTAVFSIHSLP